MKLFFGLLVIGFLIWLLTRPLFASRPVYVPTVRPIYQPVYQVIPTPVVVTHTTAPTIPSQVMEEARRHGITDGSNPYGYARRWHAAAMADRVYVQGQRTVIVTAPSYSTVTPVSSYRRRLEPRERTEPPTRPGGRDYEWFLPWLLGFLVLLFLIWFTTSTLGYRREQAIHRARQAPQPLRLVNTTRPTGQLPPQPPTPTPRQVQQQAASDATQRQLTRLQGRVEAAIPRIGAVERRVEAVERLVPTAASRLDVQNAEHRVTEAVGALERRLGRPSDPSSIEGLATRKTSEVNQLQTVEDRLTRLETEQAATEQIRTRLVPSLAAVTEGLDRLLEEGEERRRRFGERPAAT